MKNEVYPVTKSSLGGLNSNSMALICYLASLIISFIPYIKLFAWFAPLIIFFLEKDSVFVKFHAMQAFLVNVAVSIIIFILKLISLATIGGGLIAGSGAALVGGGVLIATVSLVVSIIALVFSIIAMLGAYKNTETHLPLIGDLAAKITFK